MRGVCAGSGDMVLGPFRGSRSSRFFQSFVTFGACWIEGLGVIEFGIQIHSLREVRLSRPLGHSVTIPRLGCLDFSLEDPDHKLG